MKEVFTLQEFMMQVENNGRDIDNAKILFENPEFGDKVITHRFPLDAAEEAFAIADDRKSGSIKVVFDINV